MSAVLAEVRNAPEQINLGYLPPGSEATEIGLKLPKMKYEKWEAAIHQLIATGASSAWLIGDGLSLGESWFGEDYAQAFDPDKMKRIDVDTLRNFQWVAEKVPVVRRRTKLSWSHHQEVAAMMADGQDYWLDLAERNGWSRNELRREIKRDKDAGQPEPEKELSLLQDPAVRKWVEDYRDSIKAHLDFVPEGAPFLNNMIHGHIGQAQWQLDRTASEEAERVLEAIDEGWQIGYEIFNWLQKRSYFMREPEFRARLIWMCDKENKKLREVKQGGRKDNQRGDLTSMYVRYDAPTGDAFSVSKGNSLYNNEDED